ncbi:NUDIX hydrolase [Actinomadura craniellae]|uniref:NUDIX hydrolase n=1 Tax=Actinomadura craniellae TaxID=2231787 RepID=A0A365GVU2_9ACTN|nr:NUDIX hydrolase [Actinomadura craniellae]RAY10895.1 NUDIX hydrolase [Actinomadura craniellae]
MNKNYVQPAVWYATLPTAYLTAQALFTDERDRVLLVKPNYREHWGFPGGIVEDGEAPHRGVAREVEEELGLTAEIGDLLVLGWHPPEGERPRSTISFLFDAGVIADPGRIRLQYEELDAFEFVPWERAPERLAPGVAPRIPAARRARESGGTVYLPDGPPHRA